MGSFSLQSCSFALLTYVPSRSAFTVSRDTKLVETNRAVLFPLGCGCVCLFHLLCMRISCCTSTGTPCFGDGCCLVFLAAALQAPACVRGAVSAGACLVSALCDSVCVCFGLCLRWQIGRPGWPTAAGPRPVTAGRGCAREGSRHRRSDRGGGWAWGRRVYWRPQPNANRGLRN